MVRRGETYLFEEFLFDCDVVVGDAEHNQAVFGFLACLSVADIARAHVVEIDFVDEFVLDQNQGLHGVLESQFVLAHLRKNRANIQVDVARV